AERREVVRRDEVAGHRARVAAIAGVEHQLVTTVDGDGGERLATTGEVVDLEHREPAPIQLAFRARERRAADADERRVVQDRWGRPSRERLKNREQGGIDADA